MENLKILAEWLRPFSSVIASLTGIGTVLWVILSYFSGMAYDIKEVKAELGSFKVEFSEFKDLIKSHQLFREK
jgi:hypothetical protein